MSPRNRQMLLLALLIVAFAFLIGRQLVPGLGGSGAGTSPRRTSTAAAGSVSDGPVEIARLRLDALEHKPATYQPGRDPFRFNPRPAPPKPRPKPDPAAKQPAAATENRPPRPAAPPPRPQPPAVKFVYLGSFGLPGREIAVFSDGEEILNAFTGDVLQKEFVVRSIGYESADIGFVRFPEAPAKRLAVGG